MTSTFSVCVSRAVLFTALILTSAGNLFAQGTVSSARYIPTEVDKTEAVVTQVIARAEDHFRKGKLNLEDNKREQARDEFDKAVDTILDSGVDVRASRRLQNYYLELVERIYREEVPQQTPGNSAVRIAQASLSSGDAAPVTPEPTPQLGFRDQRFEPSPLDTLATLILTTEEQVVTRADQDALEAAKTAINFKFKSNPLIQQFINYYQGRGRATMEAGIRRSGRYMKLARQIFREEGVPEDIAWLGQVESAWNPVNRSWAGASGLWQFIPGTGSRYGLRQTAWVDERNSIEKATRASAKYLKWLNERYAGNWELAMAAYNTGEGNIDRAIARVGVLDFWEVYPFIAQETRNYVPNILATILIAKNPEKYGFAGIKSEPPLVYETVEVPTSTSLQLIAEACDTSIDVIRILNPELKRDQTPKGEAYTVRVPPRRGQQLLAILKRIPGDKRDAARIISAAPGEDLAAVAQRTGTSVEVLRAMNNGVDAKTLAGKVVVPTNSVREASLVRARAAENAPSGTKLIHVRVGKGDSLAKIAARHNVSVAEIARLNGLPLNAELKAGQDLKVPVKSSAAPSQKRSR